MSTHPQHINDPVQLRLAHHTVIWRPYALIKEQRSPSIALVGSIQEFHAVTTQIDAWRRGLITPDNEPFLVCLVYCDKASVNPRGMEDLIHRLRAALSMRIGYLVMFENKIPDEISPHVNPLNFA